MEIIQGWIGNSDEDYLDIIETNLDKLGYLNLKLRDNIDMNDPNAIDSLWREFFLSENQIVLSEAICVKKPLDFCVVSKVQTCGK